MIQRIGTILRQYLAQRRLTRPGKGEQGDDSQMCDVPFHFYTVFLVTTTAAASTAGRSTSALARFVNVIDICTGYRITIEQHCFVRKICTLVGLNPRFNVAAR